MANKSPKTGKVVRAPRAPRVRASKSEDFTHIDRSNGVLLKASQLNVENPHISPVSNQATVEALTQEEKDNLPAVQ